MPQLKKKKKEGPKNIPGGLNGQGTPWGGARLSRLVVALPKGSCLDSSTRAGASHRLAPKHTSGVPFPTKTRITNIASTH